MNEPLALVPADDAPALRVIRPLDTPSEIVSAWQAFQDVKAALLDESDFAEISGKPFPTKSAWRKIATAFGLSTEVVREQKDELVTPGGATYTVWRITVRAIAPNGRYMEAVGACSSLERRFAHVDADPYAQAQTRATNRAIADLVGGGTVSAEEARGDPSVANQATATRTVQAFLAALGDFEKWDHPEPSVEAILVAAVMAQGDLRQAWRLLEAAAKTPAPDDEVPDD